MSWSLLRRESPRLDPFEGIFDEFLSLSRGLLGASGGDARPAVNAWIGEDDAVVTVELPGVKPADIGVTVEGNVVEISAERQPTEVSEGERLHRRERSSGSFLRRVELPFRLHSAGVEARYENGILELRLPRAEEDRPHKVKVSVG